MKLIYPQSLSVPVGHLLSHFRGRHCSGIVIIIFYSILIGVTRSKPDSRSVWTMPSDTGWDFWGACAGPGIRLDDSGGSLLIRDSL